MIELLEGDCLEVMKEIPDGSIDMVLTDPPYGTTACKWDSVIPLEPMWEHLKRVIKPNGAIVLFGQEPFSSSLRMSNLGMFKYDWYWKKSRPGGFVNARIRSLKDIEVISVFSAGTCANGGKSNMPYFPQGVGEGIGWKRPNKYYNESEINLTRKSHALERKTHGSGYPRQILEYPNHNGGQVHPTQKPVALMEYLIKTYTNEGETVLDFTMGSGTTGVAAKNLNRSFIGVELDPDYFDIACDRVLPEEQQTNQQG